MIVGKGARENALADAYAKSYHVDHIYVAPGNAGSIFIPKTKQLKIDTIDGMIDFVQKQKIDLTDVGPEGYLAKGIVDKFYDAGITRIVGQKSATGILETSKCWAKDFWHRHKISIPEYKNFDNPEDAKNYIKKFFRENSGENVVVKADGICAGKGSIVCDNLEQALFAVDRIMVKREFDNLEGGIRAGDKVVVERRLYGLEMMFYVLTDGKTIKFAGTAQDSKRAFDYGDTRIKIFFNGINPNTGGMISSSPHRYEEKFRDMIMEEIAIPTLTKFQAETGYEYLGYGYFGLMLSVENGEIFPRIEEFNRRHGDPEASAILPRIKTDYYEVANAIVERGLHEVNIEFEPLYTYALVAVSGNISIGAGIPKGETGLGWFDAKPDKMYKGYPSDDHLTNQPIKGLRDVDSNCRIYYSGTTFRQWNPKDPNSIDPSRGDEDGNLETTGGRVLELVAKGNTLEEAKAKAENEMKKIFFRGIRYRKTHDEKESMLDSLESRSKSFIK